MRLRGPIPRALTHCFGGASTQVGAIRARRRVRLRLEDETKVVPHMVVHARARRRLEPIRCNLPDRDAAATQLNGGWLGVGVFAEDHTRVIARRRGTRSDGHQHALARSTVRAIGALCCLRSFRPETNQKCHDGQKRSRPGCESLRAITWRPRNEYHRCEWCNRLGSSVCATWGGKRPFVCGHSSMQDRHATVPLSVAGLPQGEVTGITVQGRDASSPRLRAPSDPPWALASDRLGLSTGCCWPTLRVGCAVLCSVSLLSA